MTPLAHGIGGVRDLPVPESFFFSTAAIVLVVSFILLGALWRRPQLEQRAEGVSLGGVLQAVFASRILRALVQAASVALFLVVLSSALFGTEVELRNFTPTFVYVIFWLGLPLLSVTLGDVWRVLSPWRAVADAVVWVLERAGYEALPVYSYPERLGRYPAAVALFAFVALELAHPRPAAPRTLAIAISLYTYWALAGMAVYGRETWTRSGEGFAVMFNLLSRIAPIGVREGHVVVRWPFSGLGGVDRVPGTLVFVAVMLGSTSFDGFSRTSAWQNLLGDVREQLVGRSLAVIDLATTGVNLLGLAALVGAVVLTYVVAVESARRLVRAPRNLVPDFVLSLVPIALGYMVAHYFSLFVLQGQFIFFLASDPLGRGWDLFGTADIQPDLTLLSPNTIWYVQVVALVVGHVAGLAIAHDRAVALFEKRENALRSQYPMLALMVLYTVAGLWLLSQG
jgi:hypothetical protein